MTKIVQKQHCLMTIFADTISDKMVLLNNYFYHGALLDFAKNW